MLSDTLKKFGYPESLIKEYDNWLLLCRPKQVTLGALVLISKQGETAFSQIPQTGFTELNDIIKKVEPALKNIFGCNKINYLMLMMHDPEVHFHILPRYAQEIVFENKTFQDIGWPGMANLKATDFPEGQAINQIDQEIFKKII
jgi:diadenosine tetraphosphate (Ap4A) HIT family hydrolase